MRNGGVKMSAYDLDELERLEKAASPGPWRDTRNAIGDQPDGLIEEYAIMGPTGPVMGIWPSVGHPYFTSR